MKDVPKAYVAGVLHSNSPLHLFGDKKEAMKLVYIKVTKEAMAVMCRDEVQWAILLACD